MGNLFSEEEKDDGLIDLDKIMRDKLSLNDDNAGYAYGATYGGYVRHMEANRVSDSDDTGYGGYSQDGGQSYDGSYGQHGGQNYDDSYGQHRGQSYNRVSDSDDTRDDAYENCSRFMRSAAAKSAVSGPEGFSNMNRIEGARKAVIAALKEYHPGFFEAMPKRKDGLPNRKYGDIKAVYKVMGQYMPVLNKDGSLHRGCRVYKIILQEAGIDYNTLTERESHDLYKYWNGRDPNTDMIRNPRLASALRMAHSVKHIGSLDAGHANCLLYLAGLKNEEKEGRGRQGNSSGSGSGSGSIRCASDAAASTPRRWPPPRLRQNERQREDYDTRDYSSDDTRDYSSDDTRDYERQEYERQEYERQEYERQREEYERQEYERQREEYERQEYERQEYERQREEYERQEYERQEYERQEYERQREEYERREYERQEYERQEYERQREEYERQEYERQREEEYEPRYYGTVDEIKKNHANGNEYAFVEPGNIFLHPSDMRSGEGWVYEGDQISFSVGYFENDPRPKCVDVVRL